jgi:hypothetical protein
MLKEILKLKFVTMGELYDIVEDPEVVLVQFWGINKDYPGFSWYMVKLNNEEECSVYV